MSRQQPKNMWYKDALYDDRCATAAYSDEDETTNVEIYEEVATDVFVDGATDIFLNLSFMIFRNHYISYILFRTLFINISFIIFRNL